MTDATATLTTDMLPPSLSVDSVGTIRVGDSRVSLDVVVQQYENGMTPEAMVQAYDTLGLADVYDVIAYYLRHREAVQSYLTHRAAEAEEIQAKIEGEHPPVSRGDLVVRRTAVVNGDASARQ